MEPKFKIGDRVQLKAVGSPEMVIKTIGESPSETTESRNYICQWFTSEKLLQQGSFPEDSLSSVQPNVGGEIVRY